ncbi:MULTISPECIES: SAM-dependent methyltransferase [unclassified Nocardiopsis]|uniref:SAM-dependent methyltransferase n=1 Tax=unclassified Nocardiopsis TaxID=2649073 RepID=UPI00066BDBE9|nr:MULTISPECIES: SAM-dependent methyltransferase [unclassified Nocardiopsis]MBQ1084238.1 SAM-dependent methyltransferase [Nocardiopsis sp. B62]
MSRFTSPDFLRQAGDNHVRAKPPPPVNLARANINRLHSFHLKGKDHFQVDRDLAARAENTAAGFVDLVLGERAFLQRAVRHLSAELGIRQFLQVGAGMPTSGDPHEIAHESFPDTRVVYASHDPVVLAHHLALIRDGRTTTAVRGGLEDVPGLLRDPETSLLDLDQPVGLLLTGVVSHLGDLDTAARGIAELRGALAPGSHMVLSHYCRPDPVRHPKDAFRAEQLQQLFTDQLGHGYWRAERDIAALFDGWESVPPGLLQAQKWRTLPVAPPIPGSYQMPHRNRQLIIGGMGRV